MQNRYTVRYKIAGIYILLLIVFHPVFGRAPVLTPKEITNAPPRVIRTCCAFGANLQLGFIPFVKYTDITSPAEIGSHEYLGGKKERNGNIYTRSGGFIDLGHLRDCADWTAYLYNLILTSRENPECRTIDLGFEGGPKKLVLNITCEPDTFDVALLAGKIAYDLSLWHEIATWYGASLIPAVPERYSSFSPEDLYSNLLGIHLAIQALQSPDDYNNAMTRLIAATLDRLDAVATRDETYSAMEKVENSWWTNKKHLPSKKIILKRYLDSENILVPWLVPGEDKNTHPCPLAKPATELNAYFRLEIKPNYHFPTKKIFGKKNIHTITQVDFETLLQQINSEIHSLDLKMTKQAARKKYRKTEQIQ